MKYLSAVILLVFSQCAVADQEQAVHSFSTSAWIGQYSNRGMLSSTGITLFPGGYYEGWSRACSPSMNEERGSWKEADGWITVIPVSANHSNGLGPRRYKPMLIEGIHCLVSERLSTEDYDNEQFLNYSLTNSKERTAANFKYSWEESFDFDEDYWGNSANPR